MRCQEVTQPDKRKKVAAGQCTNEAKWLVTMRGITVLEIKFCTPHFDNWRKHMNGSKHEWSATPINRQVTK